MKMRYTCIFVKMLTNFQAEFLTNSPAGSLKTVDDAVRMAEQIRTLGAKTVIVTLGKKGSIVVPGANGPFDHVPCPVVKAVDTTGAGDSWVLLVLFFLFSSFVGSLATLTARHPHLPLVERVSRACVVASMSVQHAGTQASYAYAKDLDAGLLE